MSEINRHQRIREELTAVVGAGNVFADAETRAEYSQDLMEWDGAPPVALVVHPADTSETARVVHAAAGLGYAIAPRGAGLSYTRGYVPEDRDTIAVDVTRLSRIVRCDPQDLYIICQAGATWEAARAAARAQGLRLAMPGPISGSASTIGGAASQNVLGSMHGMIGLEVVLSDGQVLRTGSGGKIRERSNFSRHFGPDLTGIFLGDTGAFGIKTEVTLQLEPVPEGQAIASFSFPAMDLLASAMVEITRRGLARRLLGMDPIKTRGASGVDLLEAGRTVAAVATTGRKLGGGLAQAFRLMTSGRDALDDAEWALHVNVDGFDTASAGRRMAAIREICLREGTEIAPNISVALDARPYSIRGFLGLQGERWIPIHAIFPLSQVSRAVDRVEAFFRSHAALLDEHGIGTCCCLFTEGPTVAIEPMFYWRDAIGPLHKRHLSEKNRQRFSAVPADPRLRGIVSRLRGELKDLFFELGAIHNQVGKYYDFAGAAEPGLYDVLTKVKQALDPEGRLNPGNFGWRRRATTP